MQVFFRTRAELEAFLGHLPSLHCPSCGAVGNLVRHGYIRWFRSPEENGIRAWRIRCKKSPRRHGCGRAPSIRLGGCIPRRCFDTTQLWAFVQALLNTRSVKAAWEQAGIPMSLDTGYRLYRHLNRCQSVLRTHLCARSPPPKGKAGVPLFQVFAHLKETFGNKNPTQSYQEHFQRSVLATAASQPAHPHPNHSTGCLARLDYEALARTLTIDWRSHAHPASVVVEDTPPYDANGHHGGNL